jgi:hypothetical protein
MSFRAIWKRSVDLRGFGNTIEQCYSEICEEKKNQRLRVSSLSDESDVFPRKLKNCSEAALALEWNILAHSDMKAWRPLLKFSVFKKQCQNFSLKKNHKLISRRFSLCKRSLLKNTLFCVSQEKLLLFGSVSHLFPSKFLLLQVGDRAMAQT